MSEGGGWGEVLGAATRQEVWHGALMVSRRPRITVWWKAWHDPTGASMDLLHVGVTGKVVGGEDPRELVVLAHRTLGGIVQMAWNTVGKELNIETRRLQEMQNVNAAPFVTGWVSVKAYSGRDFDPFMAAIQRMAEVVERGVEET